MKRLKNYTIIIISAFVGNFILAKFTERFRFSTELHWIYVYGQPFVICMTLLLVVFSFANAILILRERNTAWKDRLLWMILSLAFLLYFFISITYALMENNLVESVRIEDASSK